MDSANVRFYLRKRTKYEGTSDGAEFREDGAERRTSRTAEIIPKQKKKERGSMKR